MRRLVTEFELIGIPPNALGRKYLLDAILMVVQGNDERVHKHIAEKYRKSEHSIERAMQNAIAKAWNTMAIEDLLEHYTARIHSTKGTPTVMEFIYYYAEKVKL